MAGRVGAFEVDEISVCVGLRIGVVGEGVWVSGVFLATVGVLRIFVSFCSMEFWFRVSACVGCRARRGWECARVLGGGS